MKMVENISKDDLLDIQELSVKLLTLMHSIFRGCDSNIVLNTINLTTFAILKEFQKETGTDKDIVNLYIEGLNKLKNSPLSDFIDYEENNGGL